MKYTGFLRHSIEKIGPSTKRRLERLGTIIHSSLSNFEQYLEEIGRQKREGNKISFYIFLHMVTISHMDTNTLLFWKFSR